MKIDPSKPTDVIVLQLRKQLQLASSPLTGRAGLAPLLDDDAVVFE